MKNDISKIINITIPNPPQAIYGSEEETESTEAEPFEIGLKRCLEYLKTEFD